MAQRLKMDHGAPKRLLKGYQRNCIRTSTLEHWKQRTSKTGFPLGDKFGAGWQKCCEWCRWKFVVSRQDCFRYFHRKKFAPQTKIIFPRKPQPLHLSPGRIPAWRCTIISFDPRATTINNDIVIRYIGFNLNTTRYFQILYTDKANAAWLIHWSLKVTTLHFMIKTCNRYFWNAQIDKNLQQNYWTILYTYRPQKLHCKVTNCRAWQLSFQGLAFCKTVFIIIIYSSKRSQTFNCFHFAEFGRLTIWLGCNAHKWDHNLGLAYDKTRDELSLYHFKLFVNMCLFFDQIRW